MLNYYYYQDNMQNKIFCACYGTGLTKDQIKNSIKNLIESGCSLENILNLILSRKINLLDYLT